MANDSTQLVPLPADFITRVLPQITSMLELKVTLHLFALVTRQTSRPRRVSWDALVADEILAQSLQVVAVHARPSDLLAEGLGLAVQRGGAAGRGGDVDPTLGFKVMTLTNP